MIYWLFFFCIWKFYLFISFHAFFLLFALEHKTHVLAVICISKAKLLQFLMHKCSCFSLLQLVKISINNNKIKKTYCRNDCRENLFTFETISGFNLFSGGLFYLKKKELNLKIINIMAKNNQLVIFWVYTAVVVVVNIVLLLLLAAAVGQTNLKLTKPELLNNRFNSIFYWSLPRVLWTWAKAASRQNGCGYINSIFYILSYGILCS